VKNITKASSRKLSASRQSLKTFLFHSETKAQSVGEPSRPPTIKYLSVPNP